MPEKVLPFFEGQSAYRPEAPLHICPGVLDPLRRTSYEVGQLADLKVPLVC
jgi:hypothetical protein